jgi:hypothetical protein
MNNLLKYLALSVGLMTVGAAVVGAQQTSAPPAAAITSTNVAATTSGIGPKIQFATPVYDFGRSKSGEPVKYTYVFTNTGDRLLILSAVQPQCGCTAAGDWTKQVEPGKTGLIPIQFNGAANGPVIKQVTVTCNVTNHPTVILQLKGTLYRPFELIPPMAVLNVPPDAESASSVVAITNNMEEPLVLSMPESNNRAFTAELKTNALGKGYQLIVSAVPPMPQGSVQGQITLRTSSTNPAVISVPVAISVQPVVMVIPSYITLASGPLGKAVTNSVSIQNNSTNLLTLSEPTVNASGAEAQIREMQPGKSFTAMVAFPEGFQVTPGQQVELSIKSSNPKFPLIKVPVMQMPRPAPPPMAPTPTVVPATPVAPVKKVSSAGPRPLPTPPPLPPGF